MIKFPEIIRRKFVNRKSIFEKKAELLENKAFREAYEALEDEFNLARELIAARKRAGMTQEDVAQKMNTTQSVVARLESGKRVPSTTTLLKFAEATGSKLHISFTPAPAPAPAS